MKAVSRTPFQFAPLAGRIRFPGHSLTLIVKGTFDLTPGGRATPAEEQLAVTGDLFHPDDQDLEGSCRYESDFAYHKPRADLLLAGTCHPPAGEPALACNVTFRVGDHARKLRVWGNRKWQGPRGFRKISDPEPFTRMELRYENSFGGKGFKPNPTGKGFHSEQDESGQKVLPLPNIEDPGDFVSSPRSKPQPAGFGPLGRTWKDRAAKLGTYKGDWVKERWPWFPRDFKYGHFSAAPTPMQVENYLSGDEDLFFRHLHPEHANYEARLPGIRVRCFLDERVTPGEDRTLFREVRMKLDTLWADMDAEKLVLVWRGHTQVLSEDFEEMEHVFIMSEPVAEEPATPKRCRKLFLETLAEAEEVEASELPPDPQIDEPATPSAAVPAAPKSALRRQAEASMLGMMAAAGFELASLSPEAQAKMQEDQDQIIDESMEDDTEGTDARKQAEMEAQLAKDLAEHGIDLHAPPPVSPAAKQEQKRLLRELGADDIDTIMGDSYLEKYFAIMAALLPKVGVDPEDITPLIEEAKKRELIVGPEGPEPGTQDDDATDQPDEAAESPPPATAESVAEKAAAGESFADQDLGGIDLSGQDLGGSDFSRANLAGAVFVGTHLAGAIFEGANLTEANMSGADLRTANLAGADLTSARLENANLADADLTGATLKTATLGGATLTDATFEDAKMGEAGLTGARATGAVFIAADLAGARFGGGDFRSADFSEATLSGSDFTSANLDNASIEGATCVDVRFDKANLTGLRASEGTDFSRCTFVRIRGAESIWSDAELAEADFSFAQMERASFMGASMRGANLYGADMKYARFIKADLTGARLARMNLFEGSLEKADLSQADLREANMYAVEFLDAVLTDTRLDGANLHGSKLA